MPWGIDRVVAGTVVDVWGDPPEHVQVQLEFDDPNPDGPVVLLLAPSMVQAA